jgi:hypothetical protein
VGSRKNEKKVSERCNDITDRQPGRYRSLERRVEFMSVQCAQRFAAGKTVVSISGAEEI